jgi:hypothetical protein
VLDGGGGNTVVVLPDGSSIALLGVDYTTVGFADFIFGGP